jgi:predicted DNA-binding transcriptional regulator AlpA
VSYSHGVFEKGLIDWVARFQELLSAHDVARLTRRPKLVISGLVLLRRFPKKQRYRGRQVGWLRSDVLDWLSRDLATDAAEPVARRCVRANPHQPCLPLECSSACHRASRCSTRRSRVQVHRDGR